MKKLLLICVNYKSHDALKSFLESVHRAAENAKGTLQVDIEVVDNSEHNVGYLGGALPVYNEKAKDYDFVSISNVDLQLAPDFFEKLTELKTENVGWIAPDIYTGKRDLHENPARLKRPTKWNFLIWFLIYSNTFLYKLYHLLYILKSRKRADSPSCTIYAGHGSFMLFTKEFIAQYDDLQFPTFLYGEEIFFAELIRAANLKVLYTPTLLINNTGNVSTGRVSLKQRSQWSIESLLAIYNTYFKG